jgi:wobble nucleotide-excising tRNase
MIKSIDINSFGSYSNFTWNTVLDADGNVCELKRLNILYGRNYAGKTTLSRLVRFLETGILPDKYDAPSFSISTIQGIITQNDETSGYDNVRVFNKDYVNEHLGFLINENDGQVTAFAIIGKENKEIEKNISDLQSKLGSEEDKIGLKFQLSEKRKDTDAKRISKNNADESLRQKLFNKANKAPNGIKHNTLYKSVTYNTNDIQRDIKTVRKKSISILDEDVRQEKERFLNEKTLPELKKEIPFTPKIKELLKTSNELLEKKIAPSEAIQDLLNDSVLQTWAKQGIPLHKDKRETCGFCGQPIPDDLWNKLDSHFSKESQELEESINNKIKEIDGEKTIIDSLLTLKQEDFYSVLQSEYKVINADLETLTVEYKTVLDKITEALNSRLEDIFNAKSIQFEYNNEINLVSKLKALEELVDKNNQKTNVLEKEQDETRGELRLSEIAKFMSEIDIDNEESTIKKLDDEFKSAQEDQYKLETEIANIDSEIVKLQTQLKDEKKGAEKVNEYLNHYFGHDSLRLEAFEDSETSTYKFRIKRGDNIAYNLSEGECGLVAFCYFIAKLQDAESEGKDLIIYIDDPVSSLDSNHIFFVFSLIETLIASPLKDTQGAVIVGADNMPVHKYEQLFISTHNLEFLKYLKRLTRPKPKSVEQYLIIRKDGDSDIERMPDYLRQYITEFNHLFNEIYTCIDPANAATDHHCFYSFGNNLRRFLEAFLFFKYPITHKDQEDYNTRIRKFFGNDVGTETLVHRITNEYSHLSGMFDRSVQPIDQNEISRLAQFVLKKIKSNDAEQYQCLLESIEKPDPFLSP